MQPQHQFDPPGIDPCQVVEKENAGIVDEHLDVKLLVFSNSDTGLRLHFRPTGRGYRGVTRTPYCSCISAAEFAMPSASLLTISRS